jgi:paraquat-inducible protein A
MAIACPNCGTVEDLPHLEVGESAVCITCENRLERTSGRSMLAAFALASSTFVLLFPANLLPTMTATLAGQTRQSLLSSGVFALWDRHYVIVAVLVGALAVVLPFVRFGLLSIVLGCVLIGLRPRWLGPGFRWAMHLDQWAMPDVFLFGCAVGYSRIAASLPVTIRWGGVCFIAAAFLCMLCRASLDRRAVWRTIAPAAPAPGDAPVISCTTCDLVVPAAAAESPCPRCGLRLHARKPDALTRTLALTIAGLALYLPANIYPMSNDYQLMSNVGPRQLHVVAQHRIVDGVRELVQNGFWPLAIVIICTSIAIPLCKLLGLGWFVLSVRRRSTKHLLFKTKLYRWIDEIGRWSSVDVFTVAVFLPLLQFGAFTHTFPGPGLPCFILVVVLTMVASDGFDPRLMWDVAFGPARVRGS